MQYEDAYPLIPGLMQERFIDPDHPYGRNSDKGPTKAQDWASEYLRSDHHADRYIRPILDPETVTRGARQRVVPEPTNIKWQSNMARGRGYGGPIIVTSSGADDALLGSASSRAGRLASYTINDQDDVRRNSRRQDKALLDSITNKLGTASFTEPAQMRRSGRLRVVPYASGKGGARSYVTYYVGDGSSAASISPRLAPVTQSLSVMEPRYRPRTYSFYGGYPLGRRGRSAVDYLDLQSSYIPRPAPRRRFDYLDLSLPLDIHNYVSASRVSPSLSYVPRYYRSSYDDSDILYRPRYYPYLTDLYSPRSSPAVSLPPTFYDFNYDVPRPRSRPMYPYDYDLQLYPELAASAPRRASVSYGARRLPMAPARPSVSYYDDIEWPDYRPSAIRFQRELGNYGNYGASSYSPYDDYDVDYVPARRTVIRSTAGALPPVSTVRRTVTTTAPRSRIREIEARLDLMSDPIEPPVSQLSTLRSRTSDARNKMDRTKVMLDRYLPAPIGPIPAVEYEIESKMPSLGRLSGSGVDIGSSSSALVKPYSPAPRPRSNSFSGPSSSAPSRAHASNEAWQPSCRPPLSDVRKRCRDVICKTKGDPTYYR